MSKILSAPTTFKVAGYDVEISITTEQLDRVYLPLLAPVTDCAVGGRRVLAGWGAYLAAASPHSRQPSNWWPAGSARPTGWPSWAWTAGIIRTPFSIKRTVVWRERATCPVAESQGRATVVDVPAMAAAIGVTPDDAPLCQSAGLRPASARPGSPMPLRSHRRRRSSSSRATFLLEPAHRGTGFQPCSQPRLVSGGGSGGGPRADHPAAHPRRSITRTSLDEVPDQTTCSTIETAPQTAANGRFRNPAGCSTTRPGTFLAT